VGGGKNIWARAILNFWRGGRLALAHHKAWYATASFFFDFFA
jgi:hypothetical protein